MSKKERKKSTFWQDFKAFISRGNIVDLAVGLVVGAAFTAIVNSLVNDIIKPLIALLVDGDFSELVVVLREAVYDADGVVLQEAITLNYGNLIMAILTFLIDAFVIFTVLRIVTKAKNRLQEESAKLKGKFAKAEEKKRGSGGDCRGGNCGRRSGGSCSRTRAAGRSRAFRGSAPRGDTRPFKGAERGGRAVAG